TWKPIIRESSPSQPSQQPETIFENRLFQEQLIKPFEATLNPFEPNILATLELTPGPAPTITIMGCVVTTYSIHLI
ncbi:hypothetical protein, partial [Paenibacillus lactis]|uniref:hypothetical protein n=1 Tax=Paenibacillus lactis TaxID=228574 RepID=UPI0036B8663B